MAAIPHSTGHLENDLQDLKSAEKRVEAHEINQERMRYEEQEEVIKEQLREGVISEEEAQKRLARGRMHLKIEEESSAMKLDESAAAGANYMTTQQLLEDVLDTEGKVYAIRWMKQVTGYGYLMKQANLERTRRQKPNYKHRFPRIEKMVHGRAMRVEPGMAKLTEQGSAFEMVLGVFLLVNGLLIGVQASMGEDDDVEVFMMLEHIFTAVFTMELIIRIMSDGWIWITERLNFMDAMLIVMTGILPMWILGPFGIKSNFMRMLQVLRVLRLVKLVRMVRTVPQFRIFWTLIQGLLDSGRTLFWTYVMISSVLYVFAIFGVFLIGKSSAYKTDPHAQRIANEYFGDVPKTLVSLFQVMTLDSWTDIARPLMQHSDFVAVYFLTFILVVVLSLGNLVTAIIINNATENGQKDQELKAKLMREHLNKEIEELQEIFLDIDADGSGMLSKEEYDKALLDNTGGVTTKFEILGIAPDERDEVFDLLDTGSGEIGIQQFAQGLRDMQGDAKAKDSFTICKKISHINKALGNLSVRLKKQQDSADELHHEISEGHRQVGGMIVELRDVMQHLSSCMPPAESKMKQADMNSLDALLVKRKAALATIGLPSENTGGALKQPGKASTRKPANKPKPNVGFSEMVVEVQPEETKGDRFSLM